MIILENPEDGAPVVDFPVDNMKYSILVGQKLPFEDNVAEALMKVYGFLKKVDFDKDAGGKFRCPNCGYTHETKLAVLGHIHREHKEAPSGKVEVVTSDDIKPVQGKPFVSLEELKQKQFEEKFSDPDIPVGASTDKDGVEWVGGGLEKDTGRE